MGVQLNIKDAETVRLARDLAARAGKTVTETIRAALEAEHARREAKIEQLIADVREIVLQTQAKMTPEQRNVPFKEAMDSIYGPDGLPEE